MLSIFDPLREVTMFSVIIRLLLAVFCGGIIGIEREFRRRTAGFRTHILICLGACMATMTSQFLFEYMHYNAEPTRLGAKVITGIGFIGAGTILKRRERIKGLTTAAGLWATAIIGVAIGSGYVEAGVTATVLIELAEIFFAKIEYHIIHTAPVVSLYIEYANKKYLDTIMQHLRSEGHKVTNLEITRAKVSSKHNACALFTLTLRQNVKPDDIIEELRATEGVVLVEEL